MVLGSLLSVCSVVDRFFLGLFPVPSVVDRFFSKSAEVPPAI
jgi:hypothetical protein